MSDAREQQGDAVRWVSLRETIGRAPSAERNFANNARDAKGERKPALAHTTNYEEPKEHRLARKARYIDVVDHHGHVVSLVLNSAAADVRNDGSQRAERMKKARFYGWFPISSCLVRLIKDKTFHPDVIVAKELLGEHVCPKDRAHCPHNAIEIAARRAANAAAQEDRETVVLQAANRERMMLAQASSQGIAEVLAPMLAALVKK